MKSQIISDDETAPRDVTVVQLKKAAFYDMPSNIEWYGIKGKTSDGVWYPMMENGKPLLYRTREERDAKIKEMRRQIKPI